MITTPKQQINVKLDLTQGWLNRRPIEVKQSDNETRFVVIRLTNMLPLNIVGYTPVIFFKRNDDKVLQNMAQVINAEEGEFFIKLSSTHLAINGKLTIEVVLFKGENKIMSFPHFDLTVVDSIHDEETFNPSEEDVSILWEMLGKIESVVSKLEGEYAEFEQGINQQFQASQTLRDESFAQSENLRETTFAQSEVSRNTTFTQSEEFRSNIFTQSEQQRVNTFTQAETSRNEAETQRQSQENSRQLSETTRQETFNQMVKDMQELCNALQLLSYDIVE